MASVARRPDGRWRARYRDEVGREHSRHFSKKIEAQKWLDGITASVVGGTYVDPKTARTTVAQWCDTWLEGYRTNRGSTVRQAEVHLKQIKAAFGPLQLSAVRPSHVKAWTSKLKADGAADSYVYALHARLGQVLGDAALTLSAAVAAFPCETGRVVTDGRGGAAGPWMVDRAIRRARARVESLPEGFRFHDLRHYLASLLIASGADVKVVQARLRHASATTTLNTYAHLWPDSDESTRAAVGVVLTARADSLRTSATASG